jgi:hypothetical protein
MSNLTNNKLELLLKALLNSRDNVKAFHNACKVNNTIYLIQRILKQRNVSLKLAA